MPPLNFDAIRERLANADGEEMWKSLEELSDTDEFRDWLRHEFPAGADVWLDGLSRRGFLKFAAVSAAVAGLTSCARQPLETIVPYIDRPEYRVQGEPQWFATTIPFRGFGIGVLGKNFEGRPVKLEGNPDHPASLGGTDAFAQAEILGLYDPDRAQVVRKAGSIATWDDFTAELVPAMERQRARRGAGLRILTQTVTSPTLSAQIGALLAAMPAAKWHQYEPVNRDAVYAGTRLAFGTPLEPRYHFDRAQIVVSLDSDFLSNEPGSIRYARDFAARRRVKDPKTSSMNRLYAIEPMPTVTGAMADHRLARRASSIGRYAVALAARVGGSAAPAIDDDAVARWIEAAAGDLMAHRGAALVIAGDSQPPEVHAVAHTITSALGGNTVTYTTPVAASLVAPIDSLRELCGDLAHGRVEVLLILGGNPAYDAPYDLQLGPLLGNAALSMHLSLHDDETSARTRWHLPQSHPLEAWSDLRAFDGTASIAQPLIAPLYATRSAHEILSLLAGTPMQGYDIVKGFWRAQSPPAGFDAWWQATLARGVIEGSASPEIGVNAATALPSVRPRIDGDVEVSFRPDPTIWDGRYANNGWLQELPKPITKLVWGNAAIISPHFAERWKIGSEETIEITTLGRRLEAPVWIVPGHADGAVTIHLGYGRHVTGQMANDHGFDANAIRSFDAPSFAPATIRKTGNRGSLTSTQHHNTLDGRDLLRVGTLAQYREHPDFVREPDKEPRPGETMLPPWPYAKNAWGMAIDLNSCIGCNACVVACVAENNIPVVGREQVERGREMQWIRIDRYYAGSPEEPRIYHQPVTCMHCEDAPCEIVCPVGATVHSSEGLNEMVYNRCIGTRYCSNNCPYKVRRFNFLEYSPRHAGMRELMFNPDVTVRTRGVMEKCSYCVQRIERARIQAANGNRPIRDGEIVTACQQACPSQAIVFGDTHDPDSQVAKLKEQQRNYAMLAELNTRPRTTYLAKLRNPNEILSSGDKS
ncbi:MAG: TAT-variant-translocated molybdopterin oxidoreductase [Acidobacteriota bacterium]|nr:TAT-variant-translocated molybdopterin oxidoreductase [Acidobacteriota bacterium]